MLRMPLFLLKSVFGHKDLKANATQKAEMRFPQDSLRRCRIRKDHFMSIRKRCPSSRQKLASIYILNDDAMSNFI
jgi:hypothetical protein